MQNHVLFDGKISHRKGAINPKSIDLSHQNLHRLNTLFDTIAKQIENTGFSFSDDVLPPSILKALGSEALQEFEEGLFKPAAIGKGLEKQRIIEIRSDRVKWLDKQSPSHAVHAYWEFIDALRNYLRDYFRIHLERTEAHFAVYPKGSFYAKHVDQFQSTSNRIFSVILYLNPDWKKGDGGELRVHNTDGTVNDYPPLNGRLIVFRSDVIEHEVLVANKMRISVTAWIRRDVLVV